MAYTQGWKHHDKLDWDKVSVEGGEPPPAGLHEAKVIKCDPTPTKEDKPMIKAQLEIIASDDDSAIGKKFFDNWVLTPEGMFRCKQFCLAADVDLPETNSYDDVDTFCSKTVGATTWVSLRRTSFEGRPQAKVEFYGKERPRDSKNGNGDRTEEKRPTRDSKRRR